MRYDDIYRMDEIKSLSFHILFYRLFRGVAKYIVYGNTFSSFGWLRSLHATTGREGETEAGGSEQEHNQPGQNEELIPKRGTTSVAWTHVFKHSRFKTIWRNVSLHDSLTNASSAVNGILYYSIIHNITD